MSTNIYIEIMYVKSCVGDCNSKPWTAGISWDGRGIPTESWRPAVIWELCHGHQLDAEVHNHENGSIYSPPTCSLSSASGGIGVP